MTKGIFASKNIYFYNITIVKGLIYLKIVFNAQKSFTPPLTFFKNKLKVYLVVCGEDAGENLRTLR
ncbi:MAG TPA: hypothetical protein DD614_00655 [Clostridiales bacterium]|nr:hypothetical protein [Clostridiales bacterium]